MVGAKQRAEFGCPLSVIHFPSTGVRCPSCNPLLRVHPDGGGRYHHPMAGRNSVGRDTQPVDGEVVAATLGAALRRLRKAQGLTLQQLASRCGLSQPFLSQLENGKAMPSLMALHHVAQALDTTAQSLLQPPETLEVSLVRHGEGDLYQLVDGASMRFLTRGGVHLMEPNEVNFEPGTRTVNVGHQGEEVIYVLEGCLRVDLEGSAPVELARGDAYTYPATIPHVISAAGREGCRFLVVTSPPSF